MKWNLKNLEIVSVFLPIQYISDKFSLEMNFEMKLTIEMWIEIERGMAFMLALLLSFQLSFKSVLWVSEILSSKFCLILGNLMLPTFLYSELSCTVFYFFFSSFWSNLTIRPINPMWCTVLVENVSAFYRCDGSKENDARNEIFKKSFISWIYWDYQTRRCHTRITS